MLQKRAFLWLFSVAISATSVLMAQQNNAQVRLPAPNGAFAVGRSVLAWTDANRDNRALKVDLWYPAAATNKSASGYFPELNALLNGDSTKRAITAHFGTALAAIRAGTLRANARDHIPLANAKPFPLLLFLPGLGASPYDYSIQLEELASHGYIVAAIEPLDDSLAVILPDGKIVPFNEKLWAPYASPTSVEAIQFYEQRAVLWAQDLIFALDRLTRETRDKRSHWYGAIDVGHVGAFGHSHGGRSAATACQLDSRITACLNEDGRLDEDQLQRPYWPIPEKRMRGAFALLDWSDPGLDQQDLAGMHTTLAQYAMTRLKADGAALAAYRNVAGESYHLTVLLPGMQHTEFTDLPWLTADSEATRLRHAQHLDAIRTTAVAFFDASLKNEPTLLKNCGSVVNDLLLQCYGRKTK